MRYIITILISLLIGFTAGYYFKSNKVVIKKIKETKTKYIYVAKTKKELEECYKSPIQIQVKAEKDKIKIKAQDKCKIKEVEYKIEAKPDLKPMAGCFVGGLLSGILIISLM